jgi:hypothetical protein
VRQVTARAQRPVPRLHRLCRHVQSAQPSLAWTAPPQVHLRHRAGHQAQPQAQRLPSSAKGGGSRESDPNIPLRRPRPPLPPPPAAVRWAAARAGPCLHTRSTRPRHAAGLWFTRPPPACCVQVLKALTPADWLVALDERGREVTSEDVALIIARAGDDGRQLVFAIGGKQGCALGRRQHRMMPCLRGGAPGWGVVQVGCCRRVERWVRPSAIQFSLAAPAAPAGPFGHGPAVLAAANDTVRLSKLVLNHQVGVVRRPAASRRPRWAGSGFPPGAPLQLQHCRGAATTHPAPAALTPGGCCLRAAGRIRGAGRAAVPRLDDSVRQQLSPLMTDGGGARSCRGAPAPPPPLSSPQCLAPRVPSRWPAAQALLLQSNFDRKAR